MKTDAPQFILRDRMISPTVLQNILDNQKQYFMGASRIAIHTNDPITLNTALILGREYARDLLICRSDFSDLQADKLANEHQADLIITDYKIAPRVCRTSSNFPKPSGSLSIFTSGTTGKPKLAQHTWESISECAKHVGSTLAHKVWLMTYDITGYAGLQIFFSAYGSSGGIYYHSNTNDFNSLPEAILKYKVDIISGTPTFWRMLINAWPKKLPIPLIDQATLGGELVSQDILDLIQSFFSPKKITHIYASTEVGTAIVISDGHAGFPARQLDENSKNGLALRIRDGCLEIKSSKSACLSVNNATTGNNDGWIRTSDKVQTSGDRIYFVGRDDGCINVGGVKVFPEETESVINSLTGIFDCVVYSKKSPILGNILVADIVLKAGISLDIPQLKSELRELLPKYKIPQIINQVSSIKLSINGKKIRE